MGRTKRLKTNLKKNRPKIGERRKEIESIKKNMNLSTQLIKAEETKAYLGRFNEEFTGGNEARRTLFPDKMVILTYNTESSGRMHIDMTDKNFLIPSSSDSDPGLDDLNNEIRATIEEFMKNDDIEITVSAKSKAREDQDDIISQLNQMVKENNEDPKSIYTYALVGPLEEKDIKITDEVFGKPPVEKNGVNMRFQLIRSIRSRERSKSAPPKLLSSQPLFAQKENPPVNLMMKTRERSKSVPPKFQSKPSSRPLSAQKEDPLVNLMMRTGSFADITGKQAFDNLTKLFREMKTVDRTPYNLKVGALAPLGKIVVAPSSGTELTWAMDGTPPNYAGFASRVEDTVRELMSNNGQLKYIRQQDWFKSNDFEVVIDVNYYKDRPIDSRLGFHKDTGGTNLFVNLMFDNPDEIAATEWTQDRLPPQGIKLELLTRLAPASMLQGILNAKATLGQVAAPGRNTIQGGKLPPYAFVSWVDELVWHSTPMLAHRERIDNPREYTKKLIVDIKQKLKELTEIDESKIIAVEKEREPLLQEWRKLLFDYTESKKLISAVAATAGTRLADHLKATYGIETGKATDLNENDIADIYPPSAFDRLQADIEKAVLQHPDNAENAELLNKHFSQIDKKLKQVEQSNTEGMQLVKERDTLLEALRLLEPAAQELMAAIASTPGTHLGKFLKDNYDNLSLENLLAAYPDDDAGTLAKDLEKVAWNNVPAFGTQLGIANDVDANVPGSRVVFGPTGIGNRPRANSGDPTRLRDLVRPGETRTFLRTWVRVERPPLRKIVDKISSMSAVELAASNVGALFSSLFGTTDQRFVEGDAERIGSILGQRMDELESMEESDPEKPNLEQKLIKTVALFKLWGERLQPPVDWKKMLPERENRAAWEQYLENFL